MLGTLAQRMGVLSSFSPALFFFLGKAICSFLMENEIWQASALSASFLCPQPPYPWPPIPASLPTLQGKKIVVGGTEGGEEHRIHAKQNYLHKPYIRFLELGLI